VQKFESRGESRLSLTRDDRANVLTHGTGIVLSILGLCFLVRLTRSRGEPAMFWSSLVYSFGLVAVYAASTFYHASRNPRMRCVLEKADHAAIYLLIAGTFTPFGIRVGGVAGIGFLTVLWCLASIGIFFKVVFGCHRFEALSLAMYVVMGWGPLFVLKSILLATSWSTVEWLVIGGLCYTAGVPFYVVSHKKPRVHALWHIAVMIGSVCHYIAVLYCVEASG
jgi:hemolysin III